MRQRLKLLLVEDSEDDALLLLRTLRQGGYEPEFLRVETRQAMAAALDQQNWDVLISDYVMPRFGGLDALKLVQEKKLDLPFIIVSGHIGEEIAVVAMKAGAHDYVMKDRLARLVPAIERELREAEVRRARRQAAEALKEEEERFRQLAENIEAVFFTMEAGTEMPLGRLLYLSPAYEKIWGVPRETLLEDSLGWLKGVHPEDQERVKAAVPKILRGEFNEQFRIVRPGQETRWVNLRAFPVCNERGDVYRIAAIAVDITDRKKAEEELRAINEALEEARKHLEKRVQERTAELRMANAELRRQMKERRMLENELLEIAEKERRRIGIDLHDELGQHLNGIALMMKGLELKLEKKGLAEKAEAHKIQSLIFKTIDRAHDVAHDLASVDLDGDDLKSVLSSLVKHTEKVFAVECRAKFCEGTPATGKNIVSQVYKIAQEAITNAVKHGRAKHVEVELAQAGDKLLLTIRNDGLRFDEPKQSTDRMGLRIMKYRANLVGGTLEIRPQEKEGTVVQCTVPCKGDSSANLLDTDFLTNGGEGLAGGKREKAAAGLSR